MHAVPDFEDGADLGLGRLLVKVLDLLADDCADFFCSNLHGDSTLDDGLAHLLKLVAEASVNDFRTDAGDNAA